MNTFEDLTSSFELEYNRFISKYVSIFGIPFLGFWTVYNLMIPKFFLGFLLLFLVAILILNPFLSHLIKDPDREIFYHRNFFTVFFLGVGVMVIYLLGVEGNLSRIPWFYFYFFLLFPTVGHKRGVIWILITIVVLVIIWINLPVMETISVRDTQIRFLISIFFISLIFFLLERSRSIHQQNLILNQLFLEKTEQDLREALDQVRRENEQRKEVEQELIGYKEHLEQLVEKRTSELEKSNMQLQQEVNERKQIQYEQQRLISIIEHSSDFIAFTSLEWDILYLNGAGKMLIGIDEDGTDDKLRDFEFSIRDILDRELIDGPMIGDVQQKGFWQGEGRFRNLSTGNWIPMDVIFFQILNPVSRQPTGYATVSRDISQKLEEEKHRAILEKQLRQSQKMEAIGTLAGGIAHDFNNILGTILGYTEMALNTSPIDSNEYTCLQEILQSSERASELVTQLLTFSRMEDPKTKPLKIIRLLKEVAKMIRATLPTTIEIKTDLELDDGLTVLASETQIHQVIINLCNNAAYAIGDKSGTIEIKTEIVRNVAEVSTGDLEKDTDYLKVSIRDTGSGIPPEIRDRIFDPFFTTKSVGEGTGLGLSIVHGIMKNFRGAVTLESIPGEGSTFYLFFPLAEPSQVDEELAEETQNSGHETILVVEDEVKLGQLYQAYLMRKGYRVKLVRNGQEALDLFREQPYSFDLIFTDQTMPKLTGFELSHQVLQIRPDMPIILSTGFDANLSESKIKSAGIAHFLMKPVRMANLSNIVREVLDAGKANSQ